MTRAQRFLLSLSAFVALPEIASAQSGSADPEFEGNTGAVVINGLNVIKRQDLDFGVIAPGLTEAGTVLVRRGSNRTSVCSAALSCLQPGNRARFTVIGEPGMYVNIDGPTEIWIDNGAGNSMRVDTFFGAGSGNDIEWRGWQRLRNSGVSRFNVGAVLHVPANQPEGTYTGSFTVTVEYQ